MDPIAFLVRLLAPDADVGTYNDWRLVSTSSLSPAFLVCIAGALAILVAVGSLGLRRLKGRMRWILTALRAMVALIVLALVLQPSVELRAVSTVRTRVALMLDASRSMGLPTPEGTRAEVVERHLERSRDRFAELAPRAVIEAVTFGERVHLSEGIPSSISLTEPRTDLARALVEISSRSSGRQLGAAILYSDGADTQGLTPELARVQGAKLGAPIYAVGFSQDDSAVDLAVQRVIVDDFAFVHNTVALDVELEERGLDLSSVLVTLRQDGTVIATKDASFKNGRGRVTFEFKPRMIGKIVYQVSVPVHEGEVVAANNERSIVLKVIRDRIRVLQVAGRPSWDERFLREFLKRNPNVDLISFFILRSPTDLQKTPQDELALIPFPVNDLFTTELPTFDVVIYQNFNYAPYRMAHYLKNVREYVSRGGGFLMIGGDGSFEDGAYAVTPIAEVLPVRLGGAALWDPSEYRPRLTAEGRRHPITRIGEVGEQPEAVLGRLPPLAGVNSSLGLMPGAQALLTHPSLPGNPPVVAIREVDEGRSMSVATDSLWHWRFLSVGEGNAGREFDRFWSSALRWLIRDPELARVRLKADRSVFLLDDSVGGEVRVLGPDYRDLEGADVALELFAIGASKKEVLLSADAKTGAEGTALFHFGKVPPGTYLMRATAKAGTEKIGHAEEPVIVESADIEFQAPFPRPDILRALAEGSGGKYIDIGDSLPAIDIKDARRIEIDRTRQIPIWDTLPAIGLLLLFAALEWWLRRRAGLL